MITSIKIKLKTGREIEVTHEEARELYEELKNIMEKKVEFVPQYVPIPISTEPPFYNPYVYPCRKDWDYEIPGTIVTC